MKLTHVNEKGEANMVDVHPKQVTHRVATATGVIEFSNSEPLALIKSDSNKKGDVLSTSRVAGIMAVKKTSELIPLCHPLMITKVKLNLEMLDNSIKCDCTVECDGKTGVEMEALTGVNVSLLVIYDMCKAVDKRMTMKNIQVVHKTGGKSGDFHIEG